MANNNFNELPASIIQLQNLSELHLSFTGINFDREFDKLLALPSLKVLSIYNCPATAEKVESFRKLRPEISLLYSPQDAERYLTKDETKEKELFLELQFYDTYLLFYKNDKDSEKQFMTLPAKIRYEVEEANKKLNKKGKK